MILNFIAVKPYKNILTPNFPVHVTLRRWLALSQVAGDEASKHKARLEVHVASSPLASNEIQRLVHHRIQILHLHTAISSLHSQQ